MLIFIDTEFTRLGGASLPGLISIGLVSEEGDECYVELDDFALSDCSEFVVEHVLPLRTGPLLSRLAASEAVWRFLSGLERKPLVLAHDYFVDIELCSALLLDFQRAADVGCAVSGHCSVRRLLTNVEFIQGQRQFASQDGFVLHHALHDARALRAGWERWSLAGAPGAAWLKTEHMPTEG